MKFTFWSNLDNNLILWVKDIVLRKKIDLNSIEFYLSFPWFEFALDRDLNKSITIDDFIKHIKVIIDNWFSARYIFNIFKINIEKNKKNIDFLLEELIELWVNKLTISDIKFIEYINQNYPNKFLIWLSTVNRVDSIEKFEKLYDKYSYDKIVLSHALNYNFLKLSILIKYFKKKNILVELIWNELTRCDSSCHLCSWYAYFQKWYPVNQVKFDDCTWLIKNLKLFHKSNLIRPEDIYLYEKIWLNSIKLWLRKTETNRSLNIINSYLSNFHEGSFFDLLWDMTNPAYPFLDNRTLDNFLIKSKK